MVESRSRSESLFFRERLQLKIDGIAIAGPSGNGKTYISQILSKLYCIPSFNIGEVVRQHANGNGHTLFTETQQSKKQRDTDIDMGVKTMILASRQQPRIIEGRLSCLLATRLMHEQETAGEIPPQILRVLITAQDSAVCTKRAAEKIIREHPEYTEDEAYQRASLRDTHDRERWISRYPELVNQDSYSPTLRDIYGNMVYDLIIYTDRTSREECAMKVHVFNLKNGFVERTKVPTTFSQQTSSALDQKMSNVIHHRSYDLPYSTPV